MLRRIRIALMYALFGRLIKEELTKPLRMEIEEIVSVNMSALSTYIEVLEFVMSDINAYFKPYANVSARKTMRRMADFCGHKLMALKKLNEYNEEKNGTEISKK